MGFRSLMHRLGCWAQENVKDDAIRRVYANRSEDIRREFGYRGNKIYTTKYNALTFLPKGLYEQFRRVANLYFAFHAALSLTPISPVNPVTTITPLVFVVGIAMVKELIEDLRRGRADKEVNNRKATISRPDGQLSDKIWTEVAVGDIVCVPRDSEFPADLILLWSSSSEGTCYVETMNIDGETSLKLKNAVEECRGMGENSLGALDAVVESEQPNASIYTFAGNLLWRGSSISLGPQNLLLRGSTLRNTDHIFGLVVFTGFDTKIMLNATSAPSKRSMVEYRLDYIIYFQLVLLVTMSAVSGLLFGVRLHQEMPEQWYLEPWDTEYSSSIASAQFNWRHPAVAALLQFFTALVLYGYFVPISLYVSIEVVRIIQAGFILADRKMYYAPANKYAVPRTSNLNEELGQVAIILSDKTGTLTRNQMEFFKCSVAGVSYGTGATEVERTAAMRAGKVAQANQESISDSSLELGFNLRDLRLEDQQWRHEARPEVLQLFFEILAVCHTAVPEGDGDPNETLYAAESPDEAAFVVAAKRFGFFFHRRTQSAVYVREALEDCSSSRERTFRILNVLEFSSKRKRMSVVVRDPADRLLLLCKGADSVIFERLGEDGGEFLEATRQHIGEYAEAGLRTLALAYAVIDEERYQDWQSRWVKAKEDVSSAAEMAARLEELSDEMEQGLVLVGATAIEDKLQEGVPLAIERLARAGIKLWVLTGDRKETAINIGFACNLLRHGMVQHDVTLGGADIAAVEATRDKQRIREAYRVSVRAQIEAGLEAVTAVGSTAAVSPSGEDGHALIVDGKALQAILEVAAVRALFVQLALQCSSVICCRVSPKQKADVTWTVKNSTKEACLSIGDGANDVGMIQAAHIGVGISGVEGQQAVMAADFSISQFRFLERLILVHGGWCYRRITRMITYFFYKNFVFGFTLFFYNASGLFSGQSIYHDWYLALYNVVFTSLPVCVVAVLDQDVSPQYRLAHPALHQRGQHNVDFTAKKIARWMASGLLQSVIIYWLVIPTCGPAPLSSDGRISGLYGTGTLMYTVVLLVVTLQLALVVQYWTWIHHLLFWGSLLAWFVFLLAIGAFPVVWSTGAFKQLVEVLAPAPSFWLVLLLTTVAALLPDYVLRAISRRWFPSDTELVQEIESMEWRLKSGGGEKWDRMEGLTGGSFTNRRREGTVGGMSGGPASPLVNGGVAAQFNGVDEEKGGSGVGKLGLERSGGNAAVGVRDSKAGIELRVVGGCNGVNRTDGEVIGELEVDEAKREWGGVPSKGRKGDGEIRVVGE